MLPLQLKSRQGVDLQLYDFGLQGVQGEVPKHQVDIAQVHRQQSYRKAGIPEHGSSSESVQHMQKPLQLKR